MHVFGQYNIRKHCCCPFLHCCISLLFHFRLLFNIWLLCFWFRPPCQRMHLRIANSFSKFLFHTIGIASHCITTYIWIGALYARAHADLLLSSVRSVLLLSCIRWFRTYFFPVIFNVSVNVCSTSVLLFNTKAVRRRELNPAAAAAAVITQQLEKQWVLLLKFLPLLHDIEHKRPVRECCECCSFSRPMTTISFFQFFGGSLSHSLTRFAFNERIYTTARKRINANVHTSLDPKSMQMLTHTYI